MKIEYYSDATHHGVLQVKRLLIKDNAGNILAFAVQLAEQPGKAEHIHIATALQADFYEQLQALGLHNIEHRLQLFRASPNPDGSEIIIARA